MTETLRSTNAGERFLRQFDFSDAGLAATLIESLILVTHDEFIAGLRAELNSLVAEGDRPLALFAAREVADSPYFHETDRNLRPSAVANGARVGSEGPVANFLRDFARQHGPSKALDHPHIECMRATKIKRIIVVDDMIGSGSRIQRFVQWLSRDKTIKSWLSYGYVRFLAVVFAATDVGKRRVLELRGVSDVRSARAAEFGRAIWTERERNEFVTLCRRYAPKTSRPFWPLGFGSTMTMLIFQHKCPNTTPAIIWARSKEWHALIPDRPEFSFEEWPKNPGQAEKLQRALASLCQPTLSELQWMKYVSPKASLRFLLLAAIAKRRLRPESLSDVIVVSLVECEQMLRECRRFGWITTENRITESGLSELQYARQLQLLPEEIPVLTEELYVPQSFRGASG